MIREIKFRAWDKKQQRMINLTGIPLPNTTDGEHRQRTYMQFTGLKDRNGHDIYEGDIVKRSFGRIHDIVWHDATASFRIGRYAITEMVFQKMEVVGNVCENPELLQ